ncbi:hypothetical protein A6769_10130 [Nostoc punctiforme NIES-2108]|uniref:Uncharacterized protein n=1 Tax=Nostoc punctiforme NIES-2108 TaxID=1356359 RepID=A0A367RQI1_NOSPU|nr:hypothetical protein A6769_10130 [Nostoc punctiforme NIES-2108]
MSRGNEVNVRLTATDLISPQIANLKNNIAGIGSVPGMQNGLMGSLLGNLGSNGVMAALNMVSSGIQNAIGSIGQAAKTQTLGLAEAGDLAGKLGVSFAKAKDLVRDTRMEIVKMAAALPGETEDFTNIGSSLSSTVAGLAKGDTKKYKDMLLGMTEGYGVLGSIRGADSTMGGNTLNKLLSGGSTLAEAFNVEIFARNPALREEILKQHKLLAGGKEFKELSTQTRFEILDAARKKAITQETLASFDGTVDSMVQIMKTNIFNQDTGLFGFLKAIPSMGNRTGLDGVQGLMLTLGSLGQTVMPFVNSLGFNSDTFMAGFIGITDWFTDLTNGFNGLLQGENILSMDGVFNGFVDGIKNAFNGTFQGLEKIIDSMDWMKVGTGLSRLGFAIWRGIWQIDWGTVARVLFKAAITVPVSIIAGGISNLAYEVVESVRGAFKFITDSIMGFMDSINPVNKVKSALGIQSGSQGEKVVNKVADFGIKQAVGTIPGIGGALKTGMDIYGILNPAKTDSEGLNQPMGSTSPLPEIKGNAGAKQISYNPSFTIAPQAGTDAEGLVALIRNTINNDWNEFKANALV